jgi:hypothetical protein
MAKCPELFHKFKNYSESCGLGNPKDMERHILISEDISKEFDIHVDKVYLLFPMTASKKLAKYPPESDIRKNVTKKIVDAINNNVRVTSKAVEIWLHEEGVPLKFTTVSPAKIAKKVDLSPEMFTGTPSLKQVVSNGDINKKILALKSALTPGQITILNEIMAKYNHDDELGALSLALIWAKEKMENEQRS